MMHSSSRSNTLVDETDSCPRKNLRKSKSVFRRRGSKKSDALEREDAVGAPSKHFHDLRLPDADPELGVLRCEFLQVSGLPKLDVVSESDPFCLAVCGSYAFRTNVIDNVANATWLPSMRRACIFPVYEPYSKLYVGVFDDDDDRDDFAGRVVIDLVRLRPNTQYDITLPLRLSAHVYSKKPRGVIRLRLCLEWTQQRNMIMSYLNRRSPNVLVECSDTKAFQNVARTVHGSHMPGKFSMKLLKSLVREANFTQIHVLRYLRKQELHNITTWKNPYLSGFIWIAWMHSVSRGSVRYVPGHILSFLIIRLWINYTNYGPRAPLHQGFDQVTFWEILRTLATGTNHIEAQHGIQSSNLVIAPRGDEPVEMPFAPGSEYPKQSIYDAKVQRSRDGRQQRLLSVDSMDSAEDMLAPREAGELEGILPDLANDHKVLAKPPPQDITVTTKFDQPIAEVLGELRDQVHGYLGNVFEQRTYDIQGTEMEPLTKSAREEANDWANQSEPTPNRNDAGLQRSLASARKFWLDCKSESFLSEASSQKPSIESDGIASSLTIGSKGNEATRALRSVQAEYDKILKTGSNSSANPVLSTVAPIIQPLLDIALMCLSIFRALYNVFTWRDPILSFWVSLISPVFVLVLHCFPWRLAFGIAGLALVGPQNWALRLWRERRGVTMSMNMDATKRIKRRTSIEYNIRTRGPVFSLKKKQPRDTTKKTRNIVVPCSPFLFHHRFYDWPPDPAHASVSSTQQISSKRKPQPKLRRKVSFQLDSAIEERRQKHPSVTLRRLSHGTVDSPRHAAEKLQAKDESNSSFGNDAVPLSSSANNKLVQNTSTKAKSLFKGNWSTATSSESPLLPPVESERLSI